MTEIVRANGLTLNHYAEPYAGGCGLALALLFESHVSDIHINDVDPAIWSFWHSVLENTDALVDRIQNARLTIDEWQEQRESYLNGEKSSPLDLGFAAFYLNRTNRSGIIKSGGVIGGLDQSGNYKMDCRFNKVGLIKRIRRIEKYRNRIHLYNFDAIDFIAEMERRQDRTLLCIDPPYYNKGQKLYTSFYRGDDHKTLSDKIRFLQQPWIVTYDDTPQIRDHYEAQKKYLFDIQYSVQTKRKGSELLIASPNLILPIEVERRLVA